MLATAASADDGNALFHRMKFSAMVPPDVLESTLESAKQWAQWDTAAKAGQ